jgi:hypothetical protein
MPSNGKSSHCLWQGELKRYLVVNNIATFLIFVNSVIKKVLICSRVKTFLECLVKTNLIHLHIMLDITSTNHGPIFFVKGGGERSCRYLHILVSNNISMSDDGCAF